jgi:hypothetical protein
MAIPAFVLLLVLAGAAVRAGEPENRASLLEERRRLLSENAELSARLSMAKEPDPYLVADLSSRKLQL